MFCQMATPHYGVAIFLCFCLFVSLRLNLLVLMYKDLRIRNANKSTPIPPTYKAFVFCCYLMDSVVYKVIVAPNLVIANQRLKDFSIENDLDFFWSFVCEDDFEVAFSNHIIPKDVSFSNRR